VRVYLASPNTQQQAEHASGMPVLLSFSVAGGKGGRWVERYQQTFDRLLIDSGAYTEFTTGKKVDLSAYSDWAARWQGHADAVAGLDDISGDWRRSLANYEAFGAGFPTMHETDPPELLDDLVPISLERGRWLGIGMLPATRQARRGEGWLRGVLDRIPDALHVHLWAGRGYTHLRRLDSVDSNNWWQDAMKLRTFPDLAHLTYGECLEIVVKRYVRWTRVVRDAEPTPLFSEDAG
jgi:hypothetical protein